MRKQAETCKHRQVRRRCGGGAVLCKWKLLQSGNPHCKLPDGVEPPPVGDYVDPMLPVPCEFCTFPLYDDGTCGNCGQGRGW